MADLAPLGPFLILAVGGVALTLLDAIIGRKRVIPWSLPSLLILVLAMVNMVGLWGRTPGPGALGWLFVTDRFSLFVGLLVCVSTGLSILLSEGYLRRIGRVRGEFYSLLLFSASGLVLFTSTTELLMLFLGLELLSIPVYILSGYLKHDVRSSEAAMKYFLLGAFSSAVFLLGIALLYGASGTTRLDLIVVRGTAVTPLAQTGLVLLLAGFLFKVASVPFHMWTPDVYEGAPTTVTAFMATAVKAAAFGGMIRVLAIHGPVLGNIPLTQVLWWLAVLTMTVGNLAALTQSNAKRMLAYSSIAHAGYVLVGVTVFAQTGDPGAVSAILYYLLAYTFMTIGAFAVVVALGDDHLDMADYGGLGWRYPALGLAMSLFMISLSGIPPTVGFFGKYSIFRNAVEHGQVGLVVIAVLNSALSVYYYVRVMVTLYMRPESGRVEAKWGAPAVLVTALCALIVLWAGFGPDGWLPGVPTILSWAQGSILALR
jgi:NADH-quinone oxidoreductase subunit N